MDNQAYIYQLHCQPTLNHHIQQQRFKYHPFNCSPCLATLHLTTHPSNPLYLDGVPELLLHVVLILKQDGDIICYLSYIGLLSDQVLVEVQQFRDGEEQQLFVL